MDNQKPKSLSSLAYVGDDADKERYTVRIQPYIDPQEERIAALERQVAALTRQQNKPTNHNWWSKPMFD